MLFKKHFVSKHLAFAISRGGWRVTKIYSHLMNQKSRKMQKIILKMISLN